MVNLKFKRLGLPIFIIMLLSLLSACDKNITQDEAGCTLPPDGFSESSLVGTWEAGWSIRHDTLIIREDGFYKQKIFVEVDQFEYESDWLPWWIEYSEDGIPYLFLEGMRMCVYWEELDCNVPGSGATRWFDFCEEIFKETPTAGVLIVLGIPDKFVQPPRGFELVSLKAHTIGVTTYRLVDSE